MSSRYTNPKQEPAALIVLLLKALIVGLTRLKPGGLVGMRHPMVLMKLKRWRVPGHGLPLLLPILDKEEEHEKKDGWVSKHLVPEEGEVTTFLNPYWGLFLNAWI